VCEQTLRPDGSCANDWCGRVDRWFSLVFSIGPRSGSLRRAISRYKYRGEVDWADVFGRLLIGFLDDRMPWFDEYDFLLAMPCYTGPAARRSWDPVRRVAAVAERLAGPRWPFVYGVVEKRRETPAMAGRTLVGRRTVAEGPLRRALRVVTPRQVAGARILVFDDVFTEGSTLREVARALLMAGAEEVAGVVLARQPWTPRGR
jgi:predicted amidophosphoribosyltransferase